MPKLHQLPSDTLFNAAREIECGHHHAVARRLLAGFRPSEGPSARLEALIHAALLARIDDGARQCGNLYASDDCDQDRMIAAFGALEFSPDAGWLLGHVGLTGEARLWSSDGQTIATLHVPQHGHARNYAFSPDGRTLAGSFTDDNTVALWQLDAIEQGRR